MIPFAPLRPPWEFKLLGKHRLHSDAIHCPVFLSGISSSHRPAVGSFPAGQRLEGKGCTRDSAVALSAVNVVETLS